MLDLLLLDVRASLRAMTRAWLPASLVAAAVSLAAATVAALFAPIDTLFLRPLPFADPDRVHIIAEAGAGRPAPVSLSPETIRALEARTGAVRAVTAFAPGGAFEATPVEAAREGLTGAAIDPRFTDVFGVQPVLGRPLRASDVDTGPARPVLISARLWRTRFGGDPEVIDRDRTLGGARVVIVGVMPDRFDFPNGTNVWAIRRTRADWDRFEHLLCVVRLRDGIDRAAAPGALGLTVPGAEQGRMLWPIADAIVPEQSRTLFMFMAAALLTFGLGWMQLAGLQLRNLTRRRTELAVRQAIGASRAQVVTAASVDGLLLALAAAIGGAVLLRPLASVFAVLLPPEVFAGSLPAPGPRETAVVFVICAGAGAGLTWSIARAVAGGAAGWASARAARSRRSQMALTVVQSAVTGVLLYVALLLTASHLRLESQDLRFEPDDLYVVSPQLDYSDRARLKPALRRFADAARAIDGVRAASLADAEPMGSGGLYRSVRTASGAYQVRWRVVGAPYLDAIQGTLLRGRWFSAPADRAARVVVVNETFERRALAGADQPRWVHDTLARFEVIGVVADMRNVTAAALPEPEVYAPADASIFLAGRLIARVDPAARASALARLKDEAAAAFPGSAEPRVRSVREILRVQQAPVRMRSQLLLIFTAVALALSLAGAYASVSQLAESRRQELALRASLGASPAALRREVLGPSLRAAAAGALAACVMGFWIGQGLRAYLFGIEAFSPVVPVAVTLVLVASGLAAGIPPALRAAAISPADVLRHSR